MGAIKKEISKRHVECSKSGGNQEATLAATGSRAGGQEEKKGEWEEEVVNRSWEEDAIWEIGGSGAHMGSEDASLSYLILDGEPLNFIDHSGVIALCTVLQYCKSLGITFLITCAELDTLQKLEREKFVDKIGEEHIFPRVHDAVLYVQRVISIEQ